VSDEKHASDNRNEPDVRDLPEEAVTESAADRVKGGAPVPPSDSPPLTIKPSTPRGIIPCL